MGPRNMPYMLEKPEDASSGPFSTSSGPAPEPRKAESALSKPKPVASKPTDVVDATFGDSDDDDDSNGGDDEEGDGGSHKLIQPKTQKR